MANSNAEKELQDFEEQDQKEAETYNDLFDQFAEGKEPEAVEEEEEEASTSESDETPSKQDRTDGDGKSPKDGKGEGAKEEEPEDPLAWIDALPEEFRSKAKTLQHQFDSERNRSMSFQSRYEKLRAEKAARERVAASKPQAASDSGQAAKDKSETSSKPEVPPELKEYAEQYPKLYEMMQAVAAQNSPKGTDEFQRKLEAIETKLTTSEMLTAQQEFDAQFKELFDGTEYTDAESVAKSEGFQRWVETHPEHIQHDIRTTNDYGSALYYLKNFVRDVELEYLKSDEGRQQAKEAGAKSAADRRKERLRKSVTPDSRGAGTEGTPSGSYEDYFNEFASE